MHEFKPHAILPAQIERWALGPFPGSYGHVLKIVSGICKMAKQSFSLPLGVSPWVQRHGSLIPYSAPILDIAAGSGRHTEYLLDKGHVVISVDKDVSHLTQIENPRLSVTQLDLEVSQSWPFKSGAFAGVVVTNYLHRPLFPHIIKALAVGGFLIYETFARGNEEFGKPTNPDYLLEPGELIQVTLGCLHIVAYEDLTVEEPNPARIQRICAFKGPETHND